MKYISIPDQYVHFISIFLLSLVVVMCKSQENVTEDAASPAEADTTPCANLAPEAPDNALLFEGKATSNQKDVASEQAKKESIIALVQFFQGAFIEGDQLKLLDEQDDKFQKNWAEVSYEMMAEKHNQNAFTHKQEVTQDSSAYLVNNLLIISQDSIRNHWNESLAATDSAFYKQIKSSTYYEEIQNMNIQQKDPCPQKESTL